MQAQSRTPYIAGTQAVGLFDGTPLERPVLCERCGRDIKLCQCPPAPVEEVAPARQLLSVRVERRKRGKVVTIVSGLVGSQGQQQHLLTELKNHCGAGGTLEEQQLEVQGEHIQRIRAHLLQHGYRVK